MRSKARIEKVGAALRRQRGGEVLIVSQNVTDPDLYEGVGGATYRTDELERISASGRQVVRITYTDHAPIPGEKVVTFDDVLGNPMHDAGDA